MSYKQPHVRVVFGHGRYSVESRVGEQWNLVALREREDAAQVIASRLQTLLHEHQDDDYAARARELNAEPQ